MKYKYFKRATPHTLRTVCASLFDDFNVRFLQLDCVFRTDTDTAAAEVARVWFYFNE